MRTYSISQDGTKVVVTVRRVMSVRGVFGRVVGTVTVDDDGAPQTLEATIDASDLQTGIAARDWHLRTAAFLDVPQYPQITYSSRSIKQVGPDHYTIQGDLRLHGRTHPVTLEASLEPHVGRGGVRSVQVSGAVSASTFGIPRNPALRTTVAGVVGDTIQVAAQVFLTPMREPAAASATISSADTV